MESTIAPNMDAKQHLGTASERLGRLSWVDDLLLLLGVAMAVSVVLTTVQIIRLTYTPLPLFDAWDHWRLYLIFKQKYSDFLFFQHNEHRIAVPRLFFWVDHFLFHGRSAFLLVSNFVTQGIDFVLLWNLAKRAADLTARSSLVIGCLLAACFFSAQQFTNFTWGFQIQFVAVYCAATGALFALLKVADRREEGRPAARWLVTTFVVAVIGTYCMANGLMIWPMLLLFGVWLRLPKRYLFVLACGTVSLGILYLWGYHRPARHADPVDSLLHFSQFVQYVGAYLGSPIDPPIQSALNWLIPSRDSVRLAYCAVFGSAGELAALWVLFCVWFRRERFNRAQAALANILLFIMLTAALVAMGRLNLPMIEALTYRYHTPALIFWSCLAVLAWSLFEARCRNNVLLRRVAYGGVLFCIVLGMVIERPQEMAHAKEYAALIAESEAAVVAGVFDPEPWKRAYHTPPDMFAALDYLRRNHLSVFTEDWTRWPGTQLQEHFVFDRGSSCLGYFDEATPVLSTLMPGSRVVGWAWDLKTHRSPKVVVLADDSQRIVGVARDIFDRDDVRRAVPAVASASVGWLGYIPGSESRNVTAYLVESDGRSICRVGNLATGNPFREVPLNQLAGLIGSPVRTEGSWTINGYYPAVGHPNVPGPVYGSWSGADANTGTLRIGPFQVTNQAAVAIPFITGPKTGGLSLKVVNATTGDVISALFPPSFWNRWSAWRVDLPIVRLPLTLDIVAEDGGKEWGEWLSVGMPQLVSGSVLSSVANENTRAEGVSFDRLGAAIQPKTTSIEGGWKLDGYYPGVSKPPFDGAAYGSWSGGDGNQGTIKLGPFRLGKTGAIAIPLITGPRNLGMEVRVVDVSSGQLIAILSPPPCRVEWWAWKVALPANQLEKSVMIIAEDNGTGWGQWQGLGLPHLLK